MNQIPDEILYWFIRILKNMPDINPKVTPLGVIVSYNKVEHNALSFVADRIWVLYDNDIPDWQLQVLTNQNPELFKYL